MATNSELQRGAAISSSELVGLLVRRLDSELEEIEASKTNASLQNEWRRYDRLEGARDTILNMRAFILAMQPNDQAH